MNTKNIPINAKKLPYYLFLILLTAGASLILGLLSFGGMYALLPVLPLAFATFTLSVAYEGEIYLQNIKGALGKLFKNNYLANHLAREYLLEHFPKNTAAPECPQFFRDYEQQLRLLAAFGHKKLTKQSKQQKKQIERTLKDMEKLFATQLFPQKKNQKHVSSVYAEELSAWLAKKEQEQDKWQMLLAKRRVTFRLVAGFSSLAAVFMGLGTTYLIMETFAVIPFIAAIPVAFWPAMIVPMAIIAGAAYGLLTYNTITDLINNDTINKWYKKIRHDLSNDLSVRTVFIASMAVFLAGLAIALTICTAGTWWTIASNARPLFGWMTKIPSVVMGVINPIITGLSAVFFNLQNTAESLEMLDEMTSSKSGPNFAKRMLNSIRDGIKHILATENVWQIFNPFRLILKLTMTPLRILLFMGHLVSIAFTADRMPGIPQIWAMLVALVSEGFEDAHYFLGNTHQHEHPKHKHHKHNQHQHGHEHDEHDHDELQSLLNERLGEHGGHHHDDDIPTRLLKAVALPVYALATVWDYLASKFNTNNGKGQPKVLTLKQAWNKQCGNEEAVDIDVNVAKAQPSANAKVALTIELLHRYEQKHFRNTLVGNSLVKQKRDELKLLQSKIAQQGAGSLPTILAEAKKNPVFNQHRLFARKGEKTDTQIFIEELPNRVQASPAA